MPNPPVAEHVPRPTEPVPPVINPTYELRIGLVLYGGVSLAIYMYGVAREFWHLVRASRGLENNAYTEALKVANVEVTLDVISGTSAGGINGILLAKALATHADLSALREFWIDEADFNNLIRSEKDMTPPSLLRSDFFEEQLTKALEKMDKEGRRLEPPQEHGRTGPPVSVLDLFVPGTRLGGMARDFVDDLEQTIQTRDYRKVFHLRLRTKGYNPTDPDLGRDHNDFTPEKNRVLVEVARSTSAVPVAFEPKLIIRRPDNERVLFEERGRQKEPDAYFSDGGILNNKPFTETLATIFARQSDRPVQRWLFSLEPDPERYRQETENVPRPEPEPLEVLMKAVSGIPMYQSIAGDLERLQAHNARVRRVGEQLRQIEKVITEKFQEFVNTAPTEKFRLFLEEQVLYHAYQSLKIESVISNLTTRISRAANLSTDEEPFVMKGVQAYVDTLIDEARKKLGTSPGDTASDEKARAEAHARFLHSFDDGFRLRRAYYLLATLDAFTATLAEAQRASFNTPRLVLWTQLERIRSLSRRSFEDTPSVRRLEGQQEDALSQAVREVLGTLEGAIDHGLQEIRKDTLEASRNVEQVIESLKQQSVSSSAYPPHPFDSIFDRYEIRDMLVLPIDLLAEMGERQPINFIRISPEAATYVRKELKNKLSGDTLGHFGGFLKKEWRANDILWGRLDAAEVIMRVLLRRLRFPPHEVERHIHAAQAAITMSELASVFQSRPDLNYKTYLEEQHKVGEQTLADLLPQEKVPLALKMAWVTRNMFRRLQLRAEQPAIGGLFGYTGKVLGTVLGLLQWPLIAIAGRDIMVVRVITFALLLLFAWSVLTLVATFFGVIQPSAGLYRLEALLALPFVIYALFRNRSYGLLVILLLIGLSIAVIMRQDVRAWLQTIIK